MWSIPRAGEVEKEDSEELTERDDPTPKKRTKVDDTKTNANSSKQGNVGTSSIRRTAN